MTTLIRRVLGTPVGPMTALASAEGLCALEFGRAERMDRLERRLERWLGACVLADGASPVLDATELALAEYFEGTRRDFGTIALAAPGSAFERAVWTVLISIEPGTTRTYQDVARAVGRPTGARAVGLAVGSNPIGIIVPCHRVVGSNGSLTGYGGGLDRKAWLLAHERRWAPAGPAPLLPFPGRGLRS